MEEQKRRDREYDIAIIGMAGRFPMAGNIGEYWENLINGKECYTELNDEQILRSGVTKDVLEDPDYVKRSPVLKDHDKFDTKFFGYTPREASMMDPQQRLFLECAWEAFEDAGYNPHAVKGPVGVFGGAAINSYMIFSGVYNRFHSNFLSSVVGNDVSFLANRVSYHLNLNGPAVTVQTACSTSLVSVHLSAQSLLNGECDMALAGGVAVWVPHESGHLHKEGSVFSKDGHCRAFDAKASGTVFGSGAGVVLLKRFEDAVSDGDEIYAVIKGSAVNNDGALKTDYTAPSVDGQAKVIVEALANAGVSAEDISYVEMHGTGTFIGDPIEVRALTKAYRVFTDKNQYCGIGSVKPNIGHLDAAAGVSGLIKAALALKHKIIPPSINFDEPNPSINFEASPFYVNNELKEWTHQNGKPLRAGVTSIGMGGTNAHVILEEPPCSIKPNVVEEGPYLLTYSAKSRKALDDYSRKLAVYLKHHPEEAVSNIAYTLQEGRKQFDERRVITADNREELISTLETLPGMKVKTYNDVSDNREVVFLFPGQGSQYVNMGRDLYDRNETYRNNIDRCAEILKPVMDLDIRNLLFPEPGEEEVVKETLKNTVFTQPVIFSVEYALARMWMELGMEPVAVLGHSLGEFTAACVAGVFDLQTGLKLVAKRGSLMQELEKGSMLAVMIPPDEAEQYLNDRLSIAGVNTPDSCIISGETDAVTAVKDVLDEKGIYTRILATSHAFHSQMMDPVLDKFGEFAETMNYSAPEIPIISTVRGDLADNEEVITPEYWVKNIRNAVRFADAVEKLFDKPEWILLEVGPGNTLSTLAKQHPKISPDQLIMQSLRHPKQEENDVRFLLDTLGRFWSCGFPLDRKKIFSDKPVSKVTGLPGYAFQRIRCWIDPVLNASDLKNPVNGQEDETSEAEAENESVSMEDELRKIWGEFLGIEDIGVDDNFFELGGNSLVAVQLFDELRYKLGVTLPLSALFEAPTIRQIAKMIEPEGKSEKKSAEKKKRPSVMVKIQSEGSGRPIFFIHGHFGNVMFLHELAMLLGKERPFYGVQSVGLSGQEEPLKSIEEIADRILTEMKEIQPEGPYTFGGYCFGTMVSRELAKKLDELGESYDSILMVDPQPLSYRNVLQPDQVSNFKKVFDQDRMIEDKVLRLNDRTFLSAKYYGRKLWNTLNYSGKMRALSFWSAMRKLNPKMKPMYQKMVETSNMLAYNTYKQNMKPDFSSDVELILSRQVTERFTDDPVHSWKGFTKGTMNVHLLDDDGIVMNGLVFVQPYVSATSTLLKGILGISQSNTEREDQSRDNKNRKSLAV